MRVRVRFTKLGKIRWTSHRDVARMWERAFRRVQLPLAYTEGFSPRPKVSFGLALPTGHESVAEYLDLELLDHGRPLLTGLAERLSAALPGGVDATAVTVIDPRAPSLQEEVTFSTWQLTAVAAEGSPLVGEDEVVSRAAHVLAASEVVVARVRKGVEVCDDIRPGILGLRIAGSATAGATSGVRIEADLACRPRSLRPSEVLAALGADLEERDVRRQTQWISRDGAQWEPLSEGTTADATAAPHAWERAS